MDKRPKDKGEESAHVIAERYEIRDVIGSGGSGAVYRAWDTQLQRFVAVKRWHAPAMKSAETEGIERLWREAMTLAAVQHPNILTIHDFGVDDEGPYVVMEFLSGESLDRVVRRGPLDVNGFAEAAQQTLEALIAAHQTGMIHRDIKPQNIMRMRLASGAWQYKNSGFRAGAFCGAADGAKHGGEYGDLWFDFVYRAGAVAASAAGCAHGPVFAGLHLLLFAVGLRRD